MPDIEINREGSGTLITMSKCCAEMRDQWIDKMIIDCKHRTVSFDGNFITECPYCHEKIKMYQWYRRSVGPKEQIRQIEDEVKE